MILDEEKGVRMIRPPSQDEKKKVIVESSENGNSYHVDSEEANSIGDHKGQERRNTGERSQQGILSKSFVHGNTEDDEELPTDSNEDNKELSTDTNEDNKELSMNSNENEFPNDYNPRVFKERSVSRNRNEHVFGRKGDLIPSKDDEKKEPLGESSRAGNTGEYKSIEDHHPHGRRNTGRCSRKVNLEMIFVITNFVLELPSTVFDQLSSVHKSQYALLSMLISFAAILICIVELVYKVRKEKVVWKWRSTLPWLYYPSTHKRFGRFKDIIGLVCALCQCIVTSINFDFVCRHADNPIKVSVWPIIFAFGLLCSKFLEKPESS